jgi:hypothetical protein
MIIIYVSFRSPSFFCLLAVGVEVSFFHLITLRHTAVGRTPLDEGSDRRRDFIYVSILIMDSVFCNAH